MRKREFCAQLQPTLYVVCGLYKISTEGALKALMIFSIFDQAYCRESSGVRCLNLVWYTVLLFLYLDIYQGDF